ncbi:unnamed protein product, partial [Ectocarpus sp. 4 AP-2014]
MASGFARKDPTSCTGYPSKKMVPHRGPPMLYTGIRVMVPPTSQIRKWVVRRCRRKFFRASLSIPFYFCLTPLVFLPSASSRASVSPYPRAARALLTFENTHLRSLRNLSKGGERRIFASKKAAARERAVPHSFRMP